MLNSMVIVIFWPTSMYQEREKSAANSFSLCSWMSFSGGIGSEM